MFKNKIVSLFLLSLWVAILYNISVVDFSKEHPLFELKENIFPTSSQVECALDLEPDHYLLKIRYKVQTCRSKDVIFNGEAISTFKVIEKDGKETDYFHIRPEQIRRDNSLKIDFVPGFPEKVRIKLQNYRHALIANSVIVFFRPSLVRLVEFSPLRTITTITAFLLSSLFFATIVFGFEKSRRRKVMRVFSIFSMLLTGLAISNFLPFTPYVILITSSYFWCCFVSGYSLILGTLLYSKIRREGSTNKSRESSKQNSIPIIKYSLFFTYFALGIVYLFLVFSPAIFIHFAHHDQYFNFAYPKKFCGHPQYHGEFKVGRPFTALVNAVVFKSVNHVSDLSFVRVAVVIFISLVLSLLAMQFYGLFSNSTTSKTIAFLVSALIFILPGIQYDVHNGQIPFVASIFFALLASLFIQKVQIRDFFDGDLRNSMQHFLLALAFFVVSAFFYTPKTMVFLVPTLATILFTNVSSWSETRLKVIRDLVLYGLGCLVYFILVKIFFAPSPDKMPALYRFSITTDIPAKITLFKNNITVPAFNLWNIYPNEKIYHLTLFVILAGAIITITKIFSQKCNAKKKLSDAWRITQIAIAIIILLLASNTINLVASGAVFLYRTVFVYMAMIVLLLVWSFNAIGEIFPKGLGQKFFTIIISCVFIAGGVFANYVTFYNALNSSIEFNFICSQISKYGNKEIRRIHVVRPEPNGRGFNNKVSSNSDEFNINSTGYVNDIPFIIRAALLELKHREDIMVYPSTNDEECINSAPPGRIIVTSSAFDEPIVASPETIIVNMNELMNEQTNQLFLENVRRLTER